MPTSKPTSKPTLKIDPDKCLNSGQCAYLQPELFSQADDGSPDILNEHPTGELINKARDAIEMCPGQAISFDE